jgi:predicted transcriptional regulator
MQSILISINPKWCVLIASGAKTIEIRKSQPKIGTPFKCYIYGTSPIKKVIGEFICKKIDHIGHIGAMGQTKTQLCVLRKNSSFYDAITDEYLKQTCLSIKEIENYSNGRDLYAWHISDCKMYDEPKELSEFEKPCPFRDCLNCDYYWDGGFYADEPPHCDYEEFEEIKRPPQSWCYVVEEI